MAIMLIVSLFVIVLLFLIIYKEAEESWCDVLLEASLFFSFLIFLATELLSLFHSLQSTAILTTWLSLNLFGLAFLYRSYPRLSQIWNEIHKDILFQYYKQSLLERSLLFAAFLLVAAIAFQGIIYPPNNWDSMTYHMARISSWLGQQSLAPFPTHILRQLYQPPFAEYVALHVNVLSQGDSFANSIQLIYLLFSIVALACILERLHLRGSYVVIASVLALTIPEVVLQASSTQNDVVLAFFVLAALYYTLKTVGSPKWKPFVLTGMAAGLALMTKGTAYLYLAPILGIYALRLSIYAYREKSLGQILRGATAAFCIAIIVSGFYYRNYSFSGNLLGLDRKESQTYSNQKMSIPLFISSLFKNAALHSGVYGENSMSTKGTELTVYLHQWIGADPNSPSNNYYPDKPFSIISMTTHEDCAPNFIHFLLNIAAVFTIIILSFRKSPPIEMIVIASVLLLQVSLFCGYLKWQPWHSRLHVSMFLLAIPVICYVVSISSIWRCLLCIAAPICIVYASIVVMHNQLRPLYSDILAQPRFKNYFIGKNDPNRQYREYSSVNDSIYRLNFQRIGLCLGQDDWQYPLFTDCYVRPLIPVHILVENFSGQIQPQDARIDCIVSTDASKSSIDYQGVHYLNSTKGNQFVFLYLPVKKSELP